MAPYGELLNLQDPKLEVQTIGFLEQSLGTHLQQLKVNALRSQKKISKDPDVLVLSGLAFTAFPIGAVAPLQAWMPPILSVVALLYLRRKNLMSLIPSPRIVTYIFGLIIIWSFIASLWSLDVYTSLFATARLGTIFLFLVILLQVAQNLTKQSRETVRLWLVRGCLIGTYLALAKGTVSILLTLQDAASLTHHDYSSLNYLFQNSALVTGLNETTVIMTLLCFPTISCITETYGRRSSIIYIVPISLLLVFLGPLATILAFLAGAIVFVVCQHSLYYATLLVKLSVSAYLIFIIFLHNIEDWLTRAFIGGLSLPDHALHRLSIWKFTSERIAEQPFRGYGLNTSRIFPGANSQTTWYNESTNTIISAPFMPLHPHSAFLQIWLELGSLGVILTIGILYIMISGISKIPNVMAAAAIMATFVIAFTLTQLSFGIWQGWLMGALCTTVILAQSLIDPGEPYKGPNDGL